MRRKFTSRLAPLKTISQQVSSILPSKTVGASGVWSQTDNLLETKADKWPRFVPELVIFNYGTKNDAVTGGWSYDDCWNPPGTSGVGTRGSNFYNDGNGLSINSPEWGCGTASTNNNINLTGVKSVTLTYSGSGLAYYSNASFSWPKADGTREGYTLQCCCGCASNIALTTVTVNITNPGVGKLEFGAGNTGSGTIYLYAVKFNY